MVRCEYYTAFTLSQPNNNDNIIIVDNFNSGYDKTNRVYYAMPLADRFFFFFVHFFFFLFLPKIRLRAF